MIDDEPQTRFLPVLTVSTISVLIALGDMPYGYYVLLRLLLCGVSVILLSATRTPLQDWQRWLLGGAAILYNPFVPVELGDKEIWTVLNIGTIALFWSVGWPLATRPAPKMEKSVAPSAKTSPASADWSSGATVAAIGTTRQQDASSSTLSTTWRCQSCSHQWTFDKLEWERPCPSCKGTLIVRSVVSADGRWPACQQSRGSMS